MTQAYAEKDEATARKQLLSLADQLERINPSAAKSLLEGLDETLMVQHLGLPEELRQSLRSTNIIESANNGVRDRSHNVKNWSSGAQTERWTAASLLENEKHFHRIKGYKHIEVLLTALENYSTRETEAA